MFLWHIVGEIHRIQLFISVELFYVDFLQMSVNYATVSVVLFRFR
jgi:hypothetical protein